MTKRMLIDDTQPEETRVVIVDGNKVEDVEFESSSRKQIKGNIYLAKVIRIEPSLQAAFIDYGGNRHGFLAFNEIHPDYYNVSEDVLKEVDAEVEDIINSKIQYLKEREAEKARYRAEKEAIEAQKRLEAQQANEIEEAQLEPIQNTIPENDNYLNIEEINENTTEIQSNEEVFQEVTSIVKPNDIIENPEITEIENIAEDIKSNIETESEEIKKVKKTRGRKPSVKTLSASIGTDNDTLEDDSIDDDDDDDEIESSEYNFDLQRKLLKARKLFHRSSIQDVIREGQTLLVQVVKEERGNKGAACTTYISLAGRYCVLMPNRIKSGGVSRKITNVNDRKRLKSIIKELPINSDMSLIVRTAGEEKSKADIVRDYNYLIRTWNAIRYGALRNPAPAIIYEEGNLIKRALRDMYTKDIDEVIIDGNEAYQTARNFVKILSPHNLKHIKCRKPGDIPVFQRFQIESQLDKLHNPVVQLESGGYLVINPTEALVSIDVNSGRATKEKDIEETALKTNLEAVDEIAKQLKMRDLAGLIVIDFIDMYENQNNLAIERRMKEALKDDRARIQVAKMSIFGLLEISRQRMHSSFMESNYETCPHCHGHGVTRTIESGATLILRALEAEAIKNKETKITIYVPVDTAAYLLNQKRKQLSELENNFNVFIVVCADASIKDASDYKVEKQKIQIHNTVKDTATTCYEEDNISAYDEIDDNAEESNDDDNRSRFRRGAKGRRFRKFDKKRNDKEKNVELVKNTEEPKPEKKSWWKKLIG